MQRGFRAINVSFMDGDVFVKGGQLNRFQACNFFASNGAARGVGSACLNIMAASYGSGQYQMPFTTTVSDWRGAATKLRESVIRVHEGDGIVVSGGYGGFGANAIVMLMASRLGGYFGSCSVQGNYLDCVKSDGTGTPNGVVFQNNAALGTDTVAMFGLKISGNWIGNGSGTGILGRKSVMSELTVVDNEIINFLAYGLDRRHEGGAVPAIHIVGNRWGNNGTTGTSGAARIVGGGNSLDFNSNHLTSTKTLTLYIGGTWQVCAITGNVNATASIPDLDVSTATFSQVGLMLSGNGSLWTTGLNRSWREIRP